MKGFITYLFIKKANDLLKQLDEDDMMAVISILKRLTAKHP